MSMTKDERDLLRKVTKGMIESLESRRPTYPDMVLQVMDLLDEVEADLDRWKYAATQAVEIITDQTWDDNPEEFKPGQLVSIAKKCERYRARIGELEGGLVDCPACEGEGGEVDYYGEYMECRWCDEEGRISPVREAAIKTEMDCEAHLYGVIGPLEAKLHDTEAERDRYRQTLEGIADGEYQYEGHIAMDRAQKALEDDQ